MKKLSFFATIFIIVVTSILIVSAVFATNGITYPVTELGNCASQAECKVYCDQIDHIQECVDFGERHNLISKQEARLARKLADTQAGPGGCTSKTECDAYCANIANINECIAFAEEHGVISGAELAEAKKVAAAVNAGVSFPGGCTSKASCDAYCAVPANMRECLDFAEAAGMISQAELTEARRVLPLIESGQTPGGCTTKSSCDAYCAELTHMEECLNFAEKAGFISKKDADEARRMLPLMLSGQMPGGCMTQAECDAYCSDPSHMEECMDFAVKAGMMSKTEAAMMKKFMKQGSPGGCQEKAECEAYCSQPENTQECSQFGGGEEHHQQTGPGGCSSEEECQAYCSQPENAQECGGLSEGAE